MDGEEETDPVDFGDDPDGDSTPLDAHIRLANPRTPETEGDLMLRRGFSYSRGFDDTGQLDQGLCFMSFQKDLARFLRVSERLDGEPLEEYILPVGGGFFYAVPGVRDEDDWYARDLFESTS
jgi:deferrochelatase/peroxidase EfeB